MKICYTKNQFRKFKSLLKIKEASGEIEKNLILKTVKYTKYLKWIPGIQMIAIGNTVAMNNANSNSDIDLFIVSNPNRLRIVRILTTFIFQILGVRKTPKKHAKKFCLSFFSTTNSLNFENIAIQNDVYLYFWILHLKPILNYNKTYEKFINENKKWCSFDGYEKIITENKKFIKYVKNKKRKNCFFGDFVENILKQIFYKKTKKANEKNGKPFGEIINNDMLKFHKKDKRKEIRDKFLKF